MNTTPDAEMPPEDVVEAMAMAMCSRWVQPNDHEAYIPSVIAALSCDAYRAWLASRSSPSVPSNDEMDDIRINKLAQWEGQLDMREQRTLPELPFGWRYFAVGSRGYENNWYYASLIQQYNSGSTHGEGPTPREAVLAALKRIGGAG